MRILEETEFEYVMHAVIIPIGAKSVPCILESIVMRAEIKSLILTEQTEAVHEHFVSIFHITLTEDLLWALVWRRLNLIDGLERIIEQFSPASDV